MMPNQMNEAFATVQKPATFSNGGEVNAVAVCQPVQAFTSANKMVLPKNGQKTLSDASNLSDTPSSKNEKKQIRRRRLTREQTDFLELEFQHDANFTSSRISRLANQLQLGRTKIYKWSWDRHKKF